MIQKLFCLVIVSFTFLKCLILPGIPSCLGSVTVLLRCFRSNCLPSWLASASLPGLISGSLGIPQSSFLNPFLGPAPFPARPPPQKPFMNSSRFPIPASKSYLLFEIPTMGNSSRAARLGLSSDAQRSRRSWKRG